MNHPKLAFTVAAVIVGAVAVVLLIEGGGATNRVEEVAPANEIVVEPAIEAVQARDDGRHGPVANRNSAIGVRPLAELGLFERRYHDPRFLNPEFFEHLNDERDAALEALAIEGDVAAMHYHAGRLRFRGDLDGAVRWYNAAAERGSVVSLMSAGATLLRLAQGVDDDAARDGLAGDALAHVLTGAVFGFPEGITHARNAIGVAPSVAKSAELCRSVDAKVESIQRARSQLGLPYFDEIDRTELYAMLGQLGLCTD